MVVRTISRRSRRKRSKTKKLRGGYWSTLFRRKKPIINSSIDNYNSTFYNNNDILIANNPKSKSKLTYKNFEKIVDRHIDKSDIYIFTKKNFFDIMREKHGIDTNKPMYFEHTPYSLNKYIKYVEDHQNNNNTPILKEIIKKYYESH